KNRWSRCGSRNGRIGDCGSSGSATFWLLSSTAHVFPPSSDRSTPTPGVPKMLLSGRWVFGSPVRANTIVWDGSLFRATTESDETLSDWTTPKSVSGIQVGPRASWVRKLVVFQMPPLEPPANTVLPDESDGSTATAVTRPAFAPCPTVVPRLFA